ncbi:DUF2093 domain-containing protein [Rhabdaerophilum calidifontis]|uniref:DUF2093 domain-containing protein n=1 Tax=Rhabdaerophilum calidifontis TaxID=2604328 RepID=UPI0012384C3D|nr:DUF2093 domain-containing protein [Rhabdaerophilum calidifontis]
MRGNPGPAGPGLGTEAVLEYSDSDYRIVRPGSFVRCAVTGAVIPIEELRYWSAERQEAYAGPEAVLMRLRAESTAR